MEGYVQADHPQQARREIDRLDCIRVRSAQWQKLPFAQISPVRSGPADTRGQGCFATRLGCPDTNLLSSRCHSRSSLLLSSPARFPVLMHRSRNGDRVLDGLQRKRLAADAGPLQRESIDRVDHRSSQRRADSCAHCARQRCRSHRGRHARGPEIVLWRDPRRIANRVHSVHHRRQAGPRAMRETG